MRKYYLVRDFGVDGGVDIGSDFDNLQDAKKGAADDRRRYGRDVGVIVCRSFDNMIVSLHGVFDGVIKCDNIIYQLSRFSSPFVNGSCPNPYYFG